MAVKAKGKAKKAGKVLISKDSIQKARVAIMESDAPADLKNDAIKVLETKMPLRHGSEDFAKKNPKTGVTNEQRIQMAKLAKHGVSYRDLEIVFHLKPNSGNDAHRCVKAVIGSGGISYREAVQIMQPKTVKALIRVRAAADAAAKKTAAKEAKAAQKAAAKAKKEAVAA